MDRVLVGKEMITYFISRPHIQPALPHMHPKNILVWFLASMKGWLKVANYAYFPRAWTEKNGNRISESFYSCWSCSSEPKMNQSQYYSLQF